MKIRKDGAILFLDDTRINLTLYTKERVYFIDYLYDEKNKYYLSIVHCNKEDGSDKKEEIYKVGDRQYLLFDEFLADSLRFVKLHSEFLKKTQEGFDKQESENYKK